MQQQLLSHPQVVLDRQQKLAQLVEYLRRQPQLQICQQLKRLQQSCGLLPDGTTTSLPTRSDKITTPDQSTPKSVITQESTTQVPTSSSVTTAEETTSSSTTTDEAQTTLTSTTAPLTTDQVSIEFSSSVSGFTTDQS